jgi:hypothetical protein
MPSQKKTVTSVYNAMAHAALLSDEMLERIGRALFETQGAENRKRVLAVLQELRVMNEDMIVAGLKAESTPPDRNRVIRVWRAMIDEAMKSGPPAGLLGQLGLQQLELP